MERTVLGYVGKIIAGIAMEDDTLTIRFADGTGLALHDNAACCLEDRYMHTDDDLSEVVGGMLYGIDIRDASPDAYTEEDDGHTVHDIQFLAVRTSKGECVVCTHNEHNGFYGGFSIVAKALPAMN